MELASNKKYDSSLQRAEEVKRFNRTLFTAIDALSENDIAYALIGGVAVRGMGRPRVTHDIDIFVSPDDAEAAVHALAEHGFHTEYRDHNWLYKGWKENVLVDIIFKSSGDIYFDEELRQRCRHVIYEGRKICAVGPEDFIVLKSTVHREEGPHHWFDALAVLSHGDLDWDYLLNRARLAPRRVLSLLIYAQSLDVWVPNSVISKLFHALYESKTQAEVTTGHPLWPGKRPKELKEIKHPSASTPVQLEKEPPDYTVARIKDALASDSRTGDQDVRIIVGDNIIVARGEASSKEQCHDIEEVIRSVAPEYTLENQVQVRVLSRPEGEEKILTRKEQA